MEGISSSHDTAIYGDFESNASGFEEELETFFKTLGRNLKHSYPEVSQELERISFDQLKNAQTDGEVKEALNRLKGQLACLLGKVPSEELIDLMPKTLSYTENDQFIGGLMGVIFAMNQRYSNPDPKNFFNGIDPSEINRDLIAPFFEACSYLEGDDLTYMKRALNGLVERVGLINPLRVYSDKMPPEEKKGMELLYFHHDPKYRYHPDFLTLDGDFRKEIFKSKAREAIRANPPLADSIYLTPSRAAAPKHSPNVRSYKELVGRIPFNELRLMEARMETLTEVDAHLKTIETCLKEGRFQDLHRDAFFYALRGVREEKLDPKYLIRISDIETLRKQGIDFEVVDLVGSAKGNKKELENLLFRATGKHLHGKQLEEFANVVQKLPPEDRWIMIFEPSRQKVRKEFLQNPMGNQFTVSQHIEGRVKMNVFNRIKENGKYARMFASLELFNAFLKVRFGEDAVTPNPVFGISTLEQIENNGLTNTRDVCCFHLVPTSDGLSRLVTFDDADNYPCEENDFTFHDRYHTFVSSSMGREARADVSKIAEELKEFILQNKESMTLHDYDALVNLWWTFVDMDQPSRFQATWYQSNGKKDDNEFADYNAFKENPKIHLISELFVQYALQYVLKTQMTIMRTKSKNKRAILDEALLEKTFVQIASSLPKGEDYQKARVQFAETFPKKAANLFGFSSDYETLSQSPTMSALKGGSSS